MIFIWVNYLDNPLTVHVTLLWYHACLLRHLMKASSSFAAPGSLTLPPNPFSTFFSLSRIKLSCSYLWGHNCSCCITSVFVFFWRDWFLFFFLSFVSFSVCFGGFLCVPLYVCKHVKRESHFFTWKISLSTFPPVSVWNILIKPSKKKNTPV